MKIFIFILTIHAIFVKSDNLFNEPIYNKKGENAIVSNFRECIRLARNVIKSGGNGFDAAISVMLCEGLGKPQDMGLGGGFFGIIKKLDTDKTFVFNSREVAPTMLNSSSFDLYTSSKVFGKVIGVPSALKGYGILHSKFGKLPWKKIVKPVARLAKNGFNCTIGEVLSKYQYMYIEEMYRHIFINPETQNVYSTNDTWKRYDLYKTLTDVANNGYTTFYNKSFKYVDMFLKEVNDKGGVLTERDFKNVNPTMSNPLVEYFNFNNVKYKLETTNLPGGGITIVFVLGILENYINKNYIGNNDELNYVIIESLKYAFSFRTNFGDPRFNDMSSLVKLQKSKTFQRKILRQILLRNMTSYNHDNYFQKFQFLPDSGTANIVVKTKEELLVLTSTINLRFGSWIISESGIVFNNQMSDFSLPNRVDAGHLPPSIYNFPEKGKYPISSISTCIISKYDQFTKKYEVKYAMGGAGGPKIITAIVQVLNHIINKSLSLPDAIKASRFHHQLEPNDLLAERDFYFNNKNLYKHYNYTISLPYMRGDYSAVTGIEISSDLLSASFDPRRPGGAIVF